MGRMFAVAWWFAVTLFHDMRLSVRVAPGLGKSEQRQDDCRN